MPNWSTNTLKVYGDKNPEQLKEFINTGLKDGVWTMGNYKPMPQELFATTSPTSSAIGKEYHNEWEVNSAKKRLEEQPDSIKKWEDKLSNCDPEELVYINRELDKARKVIEVPELIKLNNNTVEKCDKLKSDYGFDNWYDWCTNNWGTKWDTTADEYDYTIDGDRFEVQFQTAWSVPEKLLNQVQKDYPDLYIECLFMDESGEPAGILYTDPEDTTTVTLEADMGLLQDCDGNTYWYDEDDEMYYDQNDKSYDEDEFWELGVDTVNPYEGEELWFHELVKR